LGRDRPSASVEGVSLLDTDPEAINIRYLKKQGRDYSHGTETEKTSLKDGGEEEVVNLK
jgi:hypothetical protein